MPPNPVGPGPKTAPPTPPATPSTAPKRGWETTPAKARTQPITPPATPPQSATFTASDARARTSAQTPTLSGLLKPGTKPAAGFVRLSDAAGNKPLGLQARDRLSFAERNMHDHWFGRTDRQFSTHASEFETLKVPIDSWQKYQALALEVVKQTNSATTRVQLANGKMRHYDSARNLLVLTAPGDNHVITMYRPGIAYLPEHMRPDTLSPLAQGQRYVARMR